MYYNDSYVITTQQEWPCIMKSFSTLEHQNPPTWENVAIFTRIFNLIIM